jgi:hypothetical protein
MERILHTSIVITMRVLHAAVVTAIAKPNMVVVLISPHRKITMPARFLPLCLKAIAAVVAAIVTTMEVMRTNTPQHLLLHLHR